MLQLSLTLAYLSPFTHMKVTLDLMALPTLQSHTAMASEAFTVKTPGTMFFNV